MNTKPKQILFADGSKRILFADGRAAAGDHAVLDPDDLPALAALSRATYSFTDTATYRTQTGYRGVFACPLMDATALEAVGALLKKVMNPEIRGVSDGTISMKPYLYIYTDKTYQFLAKDTVEMLQQLYSKVRGLPEVVDADEFAATNGRTESVGPKNYTVRIDYHVPFDRKKWEERHKMEAETLERDSKAAQVKAEAARIAAEAEQAEQKARLMKTARLGVLAAVVLAAAGLVLRIVKKGKG